MALDDTLQIPTAGRPAARGKGTRGFAVVVVVSVLLHASAFGAYLYRESHQPPRPVFERSIPVQLVKLGKKRDPKLLPRIQQDAPAAPPPSEGIALETKPKDKDDKPQPKDAKAAKEPELSKAAQRVLDSTALDRAVSKIADEPEGDPDGDVHGTTTDASHAAAGYQGAIIRAIKAKYRLPEAIPAAKRPFLKARVVLYIEKDGHVSRFEFVEAHPDTLFMGALETLLRSMTLPPPPPALAETCANGVEVVFAP